MAVGVVGVFFTFPLSGFSSVYIHKTKKSTSPQTCPEMSMMMMMLSRRSYKKKTVQYVYTSTPLQQYQYVPKETVRHQASCEGYIHAYIPYHLQQRNNELMKLIRAKRVNSALLLYVYTSTPPQQYQYVPKETVRHQASCDIRISRITCS